MATLRICAFVVFLACSACGAAPAALCGPLSCTFDECRALGGEPLADPGDGSLRQCPQGRRSIGRLTDTYEGGFCCAP